MKPPRHEHDHDRIDDAELEASVHALRVQLTAEAELSPGLIARLQAAVSRRVRAQFSNEARLVLACLAFLIAIAPTGGEVSLVYVLGAIGLVAVYAVSLGPSPSDKGGGSTSS